MVIGLVVAALLSGQSAAARPASPTLPEIFHVFCQQTAAGHPACRDEAGTPPGYQWLLMTDACAHVSPAPGYCRAFNGISPGTEPCVLAYSHRDGHWRPKFALDADDRMKWAFDRDVDGTPILVAGRSDDCLVVVEDTNPLLYAVQLGKIEEKDNDLASGLKDLASLLGATAAAAAPMLAGRPGFRADNMADERGSADDPFAALARLSVATAEHLNALAEAKADAVSAINGVDASTTGNVSPVDWNAVELDVRVWQRNFVSLRAARAEAVKSLDGDTPTKPQQNLLDQAQKLLDRQTDASKAVAGLALVKARWDQYVIDDRVVTWMLVSVIAQPVKWTKDQVYAFTVVPDSPLASEVSSGLAKASSSVRLTSPSASMFGVDAGLVVTPLEAPTYTAVSATDGSTRIAVADRARRTGQIAVFFDWHVAQVFSGKARAWPLRPALQAGVAANTKSPGVFLGASVGLTKWIRLSAGWTWQSVKALDGQQVGDLVGGDSAIRTRDVFSRASYAGLSVSLGDLPLFKSK